MPNRKPFAILLILAASLAAGLWLREPLAPVPVPPPLPVRPAATVVIEDRSVPVSAQFVTHALQGDLREMRRLLLHTPDSRLTTDERVVRDLFETRFETGRERFAASGSALLDGVMAAYRDYWRRALLGRLGPQDRLEQLAYGLGRALLVNGFTPVDGPPEALIDQAHETLRVAGFHVITGRTEPLYELMVWRTQQRRDYPVSLTDGVETVPVYLLEDFAIKGWSEFATFGRAGTSGWATEDGLYCVCEDYDLDSEEFLVSFLKHEARHFADYRRFPGLTTAELEYRAKLTELIYARDTLPLLLDRFDRHGDVNPEAPHAYANHAVISHLSERLPEVTPGNTVDWRDVDADWVRDTARGLLMAHDRALTGQSGSGAPFAVP